MLKVPNHSLIEVIREMDPEKQNVIEAARLLLVTEAMCRTAGNQRAAAALLGISQRVLSNLLLRHGLLMRDHILWPRWCELHPVTVKVSALSIAKEDRK